MRVELIGGFSSLLLVVASCSSNEIVAANCGVLRAVVASTFGCYFMVPIFIFNTTVFFYHCLNSTSALLLKPYFGSIEWVGVS